MARTLGYHSAAIKKENQSEKSHDTRSHLHRSCRHDGQATCIKDTRITVELILRKLGAGRSFADLLEAYPKLTEDDVRAALALAADYMQHETVLAAE